MGFSKIPGDKTIDALFKSINVFEVNGITVNESIENWHNKLKKNYGDLSFAFGLSVNAILQELISDDYTDNEPQWRTDTKSSPPYLIVVTSLNKLHKSNDGYCKEEGDVLLTYDCFPEAKKYLINKEKDMAHPFVGVLAYALSDEKKSVNIRPVSREVYADIDGYRHLHDISFNMNATGSCSYPVTTEDMLSKVEYAMKACDQYPPKVGRFLYLGMQEIDTFKKFRYYFLVLEVLTHHVFKTTRSTKYIGCVSKKVTSLSEIEDCPYKEAKNLMNRFLWCVVLVWSDIGDSEVLSFKKFKKIRDNLSHGEDMNEKSLPVEEAKSLIYLLLRMDVR